MNPISLEPIRSDERINALDVLRGVSVCGILMMNIVAFGLVFNAYNDPTVMGGSEGWDLRLWVINSLFFEGTMRALFSLLFGVGMVLMTSRMEERGGGIEVADIYYRRTLWLILFGIIHGYLLLWAGEVLFVYGLFGMFIFPFRKTSPWKLIIGVIILTLIGIGLQGYQYSKSMGNYEYFTQAEKFAAGDSIPEKIKEGKAAWEETVKSLKPDKKKIQKEVDSMHEGYFGLVMYLAPFNRMVQSVLNYDLNPWDILPMMLLGIALYRLDVITAGLNYPTYLIMILVGYGIGVAVNYYETIMVMKDNFSVPSMLQANLTYPIGRIATALGHIGVVMIFCKSNVMLILKKSIAAVGNMALTNYVMHSVICAIIFTGVGFSLYGQLQRHQLYYVVFSIWLFQLIASPVWLMYFRFGPLEWLLRSLTYKKIQGFRKNSGQLHQV